MMVLRFPLYFCSLHLPALRTVLPKPATGFDSVSCRSPWGHWQD